ncbi:MAG: Ig-like domain-containing protein, partial [Anaerolineae bacterium]|nr:Ig-like domain-containing protein [Anaerolineae bacterium]
MNRFTVIEKLFSEKRLPFPQLAYVVPLLTLLLTLALLIRPPQPALSQGEGILPWIVSASHTDGDEIPVDGGVAFRFNAPMNRASVEAAFQVSPYAPGRIEWQDDTRFSFTPYAPLDRATAYIFRLDSAARSLDGVPLRDVFSLKLTTPGHLSIAQYLPEDGSVFREAMPTITLVFNRPVVPLGTAEQMRRQPAPFVSTPAMVGEGEWLTTTIYSFKPTESLQGGTQYTITVPDTLADVSGSTLSEPFSFSFRTMETVIAPATFGLHYVAPDDGTTGIFRSPLIRVGFDSPADTASVEASFSLLAPDGRAIPGAFEWSEEKESFRFRPSELLDYATTYTIRIVSQNIRSATGLRLPLGVTQTFTTLEPPRITDTTPDDGTLVSPSTPFTVSFTTPMKLDDFAERITISPAAPFVFTDADIGPDSMSARVQFSLQPSTTYTVTLDTSDMVDIWNTPLRVIPQANVYSIVDGGKLQLRFLTGALSEAMSLETGGLGMGLYNAYHQTRVFVTHRNIDSIGLQLYDVPLETFLNLNTGGSGEGDPPPALLRRWVVPVYNPQNIMRYDLLAIGLNGDSIGQYNNISCVEAAPSSVRVGDTVRVVRRDMPAADAADAAGTATPGAPTAPGVPASINIRNEPGVQNTVVIGRAPHGTQFLVTDGPVCADRYLWWKVQPADGALSGWIAEGDLEQPYVIPITSTPVASIAVTATPAATQPATNRLAFASTEASLKPGIYRLQMETPDIQNDSGSLAHVLIVASDNITLKVARHGATAWVTDLKSGEPTPGVAVQFYRLMQMGEQQKMRPYGRPVFTDEDGLAVLDTSIELRPASEPIVAVVQDAGRFGVTASGWTRGIDAGDFQQPTMYNNQDIALYVYTDRRLYRPGEPVYFRGTLRHRDDATYSMMDRIEVPVEIHDPNGQIVYDKTLPLSAYGSFSDSFVIDTSSPLGDYEIVARPNRPDTPPNQATPQPTPTLGGTPLAQQPFPVVEMQRRTEPDDPQFVTRITVGNYTPPEFRVMLTPEAQHVTVGGTVRVNVDSSYYFGGPVSDAVVQWTVRIDPYYFHYTGAGRYSFEDYDEDFIGQDYEDDRPQIVASGSGRTDHDGKYTIELPASLGRSGRSLIYSFEAILWDQSEQMVADRAQVVVDRGEFQVGVGVDRYVGVSGAPQNIRLIAVGHDSTPIADKRLRVRVVKRVWASVQTIEPGTGRTIWQNDLIEEPVLSQIVTTDRNGKAEMSFTPAHGGIYKIYVTAYDTQRRQIKASTFQWIGGPGFAPWREPNSNRITLQADKTDYKVGETASILIPTPFQGDATALITVERGGILRTDVLALTSNSAIYDLEITPDMAPNAFVSVTVIKGEDATNFTPAFRTGLIGLNVDTEQLQLNVEVSADRDQAEPQEEVVYTVRVTDFRGQPVQAEVGLALVDEAVLALLPDNLPSLMAYFYSRQGLGVRTANALI